MMFAVAACLVTEIFRYFFDPCGARYWNSVEVDRMAGNPVFSGPCCYPELREPGIIFVLPIFLLFLLVATFVAGGWRKLTLPHWIFSTVSAAATAVSVHRGLFHPKLIFNIEWIAGFALEMLPVAVVCWLVCRYVAGRSVRLP